MREVDVAHEPEDEREAARHQEVERCQGQPVHHGADEKLHTFTPSCPGLTRASGSDWHEIAGSSPAMTPIFAIACIPRLPPQPAVSAGCLLGRGRTRSLS